jgi:hypothetical protein
MSNIPLARSKLLLVRQFHPTPAVRRLIKEALDLMHRRKPKFRAPPEYKGMNRTQRRRARTLRREGMSIHRIALVLRTTNGRVSEAVSGKAHR